MSEVIPADDLIALIAQLRTPYAGQQPKSAEFRRYLAGVAQGHEQAARRIEELLTEYGIAISEAESQVSS